MQLFNFGCLNMFKYIQKSWFKSSFLESLTSLDWLLYPTENELSGSRNSEWNLSIIPNAIVQIQDQIVTIVAYVLSNILPNPVKFSLGVPALPVIFSFLPPCYTMFRHFLHNMFCRVLACFALFPHDPPFSSMIHYVLPCFAMFCHVFPFSASFDIINHVSPFFARFLHIQLYSPMFHNVPSLYTDATIYQDGERWWNLKGKVSVSWTVMNCHEPSWTAMNHYDP